MLIGIAGTLGAGKGTVVEYLKAKGWTHYSASGYLREVIVGRGEVVNRDSYSKTSGEIRQVDPSGLVKILFDRILVDGATSAIIESLHDVGEARFIKAQGGILLAVDADLEVRYQRSIARGSEKDDVTLADFKRHIEREENGNGHHNIRAVIEMADYVIKNDGTLGSLHTQIDSFLRTL